MFHTGIAAVKYADLHNNRLAMWCHFFIPHHCWLVLSAQLNKLCVFLWSHAGHESKIAGYEAAFASKSMDRLIFKAVQGNTAVYLLYTHARISTLLSRAEDQVLTNTQRVWSGQLTLTVSAFLRIWRHPPIKWCVFQQIEPIDYTFSQRSSMDRYLQMRRREH